MTTKLNFSEIRDSDPVIFLYHAGSGGEFISKTFAETCETCHPLPFVVNDETNQTHSIGPLHYASQWINQLQPETWVNHRFTKTEGKRRFVSKDHPTSFNLRPYWKFLNTAHFVYLYAEEEREFFARLAFAKLGKRIEKPDVNYIRENVNDLLTPRQENMILRWANRYDWVWAHELMICNTKLTAGETLDIFKHEDSLDKYIADHIVQDKVYFDAIKEIQPRFNSFTGVCIDELVYTTGDLWQRISWAAKAYMPTIEPFRPTEKWIYKNHKLLIDKRNQQI